MKCSSKSIQQKIFMLFIRIILFAVIFFILLGLAELFILQRITEDAVESRTVLIKEESQSSMMDMTKKGMISITYQAANNTDRSIWMLRHDCVTLADQVKDILTRPSNYEEAEVSLPLRENGGKPSLQLRLPEKEEPSEKDLVTAGKLANLNALMEGMIRDNDLGTQDFVIALPSGLSLVMDTLSDKKFKEDGSLIGYDSRKRPWYRDAVETREVCFTTDVNSKSLGQSTIMFGAPVYDRDKLLAVVESSMNLLTLQEISTKISYGKTGFTIIVGSDGRLIYSSKTDGELKADNTFSTFIRDIGNEELEKLVQDALAGETGFSDITIDGQECCAAYAPMNTAKWTQMLFIDREELNEPTDTLLLELDDATENTESRYTRAFRSAFWITILILTVLLIVSVWQTRVFAGRITEPVKRMTESVKNSSVDNLQFTMEEAYRTGDEIEVLAENFAGLSDRIVRSIEEIKSITAEKERVETELSLAARIQSANLPCSFPAFPDRKEFDLYASMTPAKEVGGDFYDFFLIDEDHLGLLIADVSDKGIPAALFMMHSKSILASNLMQGKSPARTLEDTNNALHANNGEGMFVTAWVGILTISAGKLVMANAGHERPALMEAGEDFTLLRDKHGFLLAARAGMKYKEFEVALSPGSKLFVYTDGVVEATDKENRLFGDERMLAALNSAKEASPEEVLKTVRKEVDAFVGDAEQFDDLTMLCLEYKGNGGHTDFPESVEEVFAPPAGDGV